jgi:hypothetical protein
LCLFFRSFFFRLWVAIFLSLRFLPQGTSASPSVKIIPAVLRQGITPREFQYGTGHKKGQGGAIKAAR